MPRKWTEEELELIALATKVGFPTALIAEGFGTTSDAIASQRRRIGIKGNNIRLVRSNNGKEATRTIHKSWTDGELDVLRNNCDKSADELQRLIPNRTRRAIVDRLREVKRFNNASPQPVQNVLPSRGVLPPARVPEVISPAAVEKPQGKLSKLSRMLFGA